MSQRRYRVLAVVGPGILVAATGVGAGDLATGAFSGSRLGLAVLWAVVVGAGMKFLLNEGLARWQLATGTTLLEGCAVHFGRVVQWGFLAYLLFWSYFVGAALMSACGVTAHALYPLAGPVQDKICYGLVHSVVAVLMVRLGGYRLFQRVMGLCIALMFVVVVATAVALHPPWEELLAGLFQPQDTPLEGEGLAWTVALMGGVGGTVTILCYGYWIREEGRRGPEQLAVCRLDLAAGYAMTAVFGLAMVVIGSTVAIGGEKGSATIMVDLAERLRGTLGPAARWAFLVGAWGAVFSSLLGVWQSVPYLFADSWRLIRKPRSDAAGAEPDPVGTRSPVYQGYLFALASVPTVGLWARFDQVQKVYAVVGALFIPILALALLILNGSSRRVGRQYRNSWLVSLLLLAALALFALFLWFKIRSELLA